MKKLLALCDSPTAQTGFARVAQNLLPRWHKNNGGPFDEINVWAINYRGEKHSLPFWIYNGGNGGDWQSAVNLSNMVATLAGITGGGSGEHYTHVWMIQDTFCLAGHKFPEGLKQVCDKMNIRSAYYMPVDAPMEPEWMKIAQVVDQTVAYTHYGKREALKALPKDFDPGLIGVIPHGCDTAIYRPLPNRMAVRRALFTPSEGQPVFLNDDDFLIINMNANQRRKDIPRTLKIFRELLNQVSPLRPRKFKLILHMPRLSSDGINLSKIGEQLGLKENVDWMCSDAYFTAGSAQLTQEHVAQLYNAADLMLTTTLGEGWGFSLTEALGCGCPIAAPAHTSCIEIMEAMAESNAPILPLKVEPFGVVNSFDNSRFREVVNVAYAVKTILEFANRPSGAGRTRREDRAGLTPKLAEWLSWDRIAKEWIEILLAEKKLEPALAVLPPPAPMIV